jgi:hypothetical protein
MQANTFQTQTPPQKVKIDLSPPELKLIQYLREIKWGQVEITVQQSQPVIVKAAYQTKKFT